MSDRCRTCGNPDPAPAVRQQCATCLLRIGLDKALAGEDEPRDSRRSDTVVAPDASFPGGGGEAPRADVEMMEWVAPGRLALGGEIARGGVGTVFLAHDVALGRDLAIKVLQSRYRDREDLIERFVREARIAGQLQHPGIVPVHELGAFADERPYFSMKLVKGQTLAHLLSQRRSSTDRASYLRVFLRLVETVAYAHERDVVHLDLKPSNVMVGKHGEVQLMDWGLAQVIAGEGAAANRMDGVACETGSSGAAGGVAGTPAYMAPERLAASAPPDKRADVFALGAILHEILTGRHVYSSAVDSPRPSELMHDELSAAVRDLERVAVEPELRLLAASCLAPGPVDRPADAGEVAARLTAFFETLESRARDAEVARARAEASAAGERRRRRLTLGLALSAAALLVAVGAWLFEQQRQREAAAAARQLALQELEHFITVAREDAAGDVGKWQEAQDAFDRIGPTFTDSDEALRDTLRQLAAVVEAGLERARCDKVLVTALERAHFDADNLDYVAAAEGFRQSFDAAGLDVLGEPLVAGAAIAERPPLTRPELLTALDAWAIVLRRVSAMVGGVEQPWASPLAAASEADADPWRGALRAAFARDDAAAVADIAASADVSTQSARSLWLAAKLLIHTRQTEAALELLHAARAGHPDDFWINHELAVVWHTLGDDPTAALPYALAALSLRPESPATRVRHGMILASLDRLDEAERAFRAVMHSHPKYGPAYYRLANMLNLRTTRYDEAIELYRLAEQLEPVRAQPVRAALGDALIRLDRGAEAIPVLERAVAADGEDVVCVGMLARAYVTQGRLDDAQKMFEALERLEPRTDNERGFVEQVRGEVGRLAQLERAADPHALEPLENEERLAFAALCATIDRPGWAAELYGRAMQVDPVLAADQYRYVRYTAATLAVRAGSGKGSDVPPLTGAQRRQLLERAAQWLQADLEIQTQRLASRDASSRQCAIEWLDYAWEDPELAAVRSGNPPGSRISPTWQAFWAEVERLRADPR